MSIEIKDRVTGEVLFSLGYSRDLKMWFLHEKRRGLIRNPPVILSTEELRKLFERDSRIDAQVISNIGESLL